MQKIVSSLRLLTTGNSADEHDDKYRMAESTVLLSLKRFCNAIIEIYEQSALRMPIAEDLNHILDASYAAGWPGCLRSLDCMHWEWKSCPSAWKGTFQGKEGVATVVLEALADSNRRFWHFNFGSPGSLNDLNILDKSTLFNEALLGKSPTIRFQVNGNEYLHGYYLTDEIYYDWACLIKSITGNKKDMSPKNKTLQDDA